MNDEVQEMTAAVLQMVRRDSPELEAVFLAEAEATLSPEEFRKMAQCDPRLTDGPESVRMLV